MRLPLVLLLSAAALLAGDPETQWRYVYPGAAFVAGLDWRGMSQSEFARSLKRQMPGLKQTSSGNMDFVLEFHSALASGPMPDKTKPSAGKEGVVLLTGRFNLASLRKQAGAEGGRSQIYDGVEIITAKGMSVALVDSETLLMGDRASVTTVLRNRERMAQETPVLAAGRAMAGSGGAWLAAEAKPNDPKLPGVRTVSAAVTFARNADLIMQLSADTPEQAAGLAMMLKGLAGMQAPGMPLDIAASGASVRVSASFSAEQLTGAFKQVGNSLMAGLTGKASPVAMRAEPAPERAPEPPLPPERNVVKIYGLDDGPREVKLGGK